MGLTTFTGPVKSENGFYSGSGSIVSATASTLTVTEADHDGRTILLDRAAGVTVTLPAATGSGSTYNFIVKTTVTSNAHVIQVASASDVMQGGAITLTDSGTTMQGFFTAADSDTITMDGSTQGGIIGDEVNLRDIATGIWQVWIHGKATGTEATPFSAAV